MRDSTFAARKFLPLALALMAGALRAGCETDGTGPGSPGAPTAQNAQAPKPPEPDRQAVAAKPAEPAKPEPKAEPMTRARAAAECWMKTEKGSASVNIDTRADIVTKCIADKMKSAKVAPKT